ncbi:MAG: RNA polymerase-binding protein DksA [Nitrospiraceae bacterium]|nr:RNA polymerase-binding protein DksA [Nitrospiraceae bacterium]
MARTKPTKKAKTKAPARSAAKKAAPSPKVAKARPVAKKSKAAPAARTPLKNLKKPPIKEVTVNSSVKDKRKATPRENKLQLIKLMLIKQKEMLLSEAESALNELPGQTIFPDLGDQATAEIDRNFMLRLRGREQRLLKKIEDAIDRIDNGTFGICDDCGNEIDVKRLEARPVTTMCIECKTLQEEEERLREQ